MSHLRFSEDDDDDDDDGGDDEDDEDEDNDESSQERLNSSTYWSGESWRMAGVRDTCAKWLMMKVAQEALSRRDEYLSAIM